MNQQINEFISWKSLYRPGIAEIAKKLHRWFPNESEINDEIIIKLLTEWKKIYKPKTINLHISVLKSFFKFCEERQKSVYRQYSQIQNIRENEEVQSIVDQEMVKKVLLNYDHKNDFIKWRNLTIMSMLWETGVRVSELCDLTIDQINLGHNVWAKEQGSTVYTDITTKKSRKIRYISWSVYVHKKILIPYLGFRLDKEPTSKYLFLSKTGKRLSEREVERVVSSAFLRAGFKGITPHSFRRGFANSVYTQTKDMNTVKQKMGHTSIMTSQKYLPMTHESYYTNYKDVIPPTVII